MYSFAGIDTGPPAAVSHLGCPGRDVEPSGIGCTAPLIAFPGYDYSAGGRSAVAIG